MSGATSDKLTKRLHISGLTSQISRDDLVKRFSSFGTVKALDGLGELNANGDLRPYGYMTIESTKEQLAKCLNLLSGTMWKGAKLRIGEAKPDFKERIRLENEPMKRVNEGSSQLPRKRRRLLRGCQGVLSSDMSLINLSNYSSRSLWRKTPLGRLIRPMRMRPLRPLPPPLSGGQEILSTMTKKRKRRKEERGLVRQRRRLIDPELWGSEFLKGIMLENETGVILPERGRKENEQPREPPDRLYVNEVTETGSEHNRPIKELAKAQSHSYPHPPSLPSSPKDSPYEDTHSTAPLSRPQNDEEMQQTDIAREATQSLSLLTALFGNATDDSDWGGAESLSDVDMNPTSLSKASRLVDETGDGGEDDVVLVPKAKSLAQAVRDASVESEAEVTTTKSTSRGREPSTAPEDGEAAEPPPTKAPTVHLTKLKDMFAPQEQTAGFSILDNLDLELELDDDPGISAVPQVVTTPSFIQHTSSTTFNEMVVATARSAFTLDASKPLFFPLDSSLTPSSTAQPHWGGKGPKDITTVFRERGWTSDIFRRTDDADAIHRRWEDCKVELTREWKRRHREAVKAARRRGGVHD